MRDLSAIAALCLMMAGDGFPMDPSEGPLRRERHTSGPALPETSKRRVLLAEKATRRALRATKETT